MRPALSCRGLPVQITYLQEESSQGWELLKHLGSKRLRNAPRRSRS